MKFVYAINEREEPTMAWRCHLHARTNDFPHSCRMADPFVPSKYKAYFKQFTTGQNCHKIKCGNLF